MTEKRMFERNLEISSEFSRYIVAHPEVSKKIPLGAEIIFVVEAEPELTRSNLRLAKELKENGETVLLVKIKGLRPAEETRLIQPHLELA